MNDAEWNNLKVSVEFDLPLERLGETLGSDGKYKPCKIYKGRVKMYNHTFEVEAGDSDDAADKMIRKAISNLVVSDMVCLQDEDNKKSIRVVWEDQF